MKKLFSNIFLLIMVFQLISSGVSAEDSGGADNMKDKYSYIYSIDYQCSPLVTPNGLAVDSDGNIYILNMLFNKVQVYYNNKFLYSYKIDTSGSMDISIDKDDNLYLSLSRSYVGLKFHDKQLVEAVENYQNYKAYPNYIDNSNYRKDIYGNSYQLNSILGYDYVTKTTPDGVKSTVYSIPIGHFLLKVFVGLFFIVMATLITILAIYATKEIRKNGR